MLAVIGPSVRLFRWISWPSIWLTTTDSPPQWSLEHDQRACMPLSRAISMILVVTIAQLVIQLTNSDLVIARQLLRINHSESIFLATNSYNAVS